MLVKRIIVKETTENVYVYFDETTKVGIVVDPGGAEEDIINFIKEENLDIQGILLTHGHFDHIMGVEKIKEFTKCKVYAHKEEQSILEDPKYNFSAEMGNRGIIVEADVFLEDGDIIGFKSFKMKTIFTPGHTKGGVCYLDESNEVMFTGDTLFRLTHGRTDFPTGNAKDLGHSIFEKLFKLEDEVKVFPGHMSDTTIGNEKANNKAVLALKQ